MSTEKTYSVPVLPGQMKAHHHKVYAGTDYAGFYVEGEIVWIPLTLLAEVKPQPEEPPIGAIRLVRGDVNRTDCAWMRFEGGWYGTTYNAAREWCELLEMDPDPQPLIVAPEPVELPWEHTDRDGYTVNLEESPRHWAVCRVGVANEAVDLTPEAAREMARALNTAADKAEAEATS